jgi:hypothetical protein
VIDYFLYIDARLCWIIAPTIFRCTAHLVVMMIYDPFTCKFLMCNGRYRASVVYLIPYRLYILSLQFFMVQWNPNTWEGNNLAAKYLGMIFSIILTQNILVYYIFFFSRAIHCNYGCCIYGYFFGYHPHPAG